MHAEFYIPQKLQGFVEVISEQKSFVPNTWTFLPDGISCLMFRLNTKSSWKIIQARVANESNNPSREFCFIMGFSTEPAIISYDHFDYLGVYLTPLALQSLFGIPAVEFKDMPVEGTQVFSNLNWIEDELNSLTTFAERAIWIENWLYSCIQESKDLFTALSLNRLAHKLSKRNNNVNGSQLEDFMGYSRAQTHRIFNKWFGLSSKKYQRFRKFIHTLEHVHYSSSSLGEISYKQGYFDQAHFIRSFKEFAAITPSSYRNMKSNLIGQYSIT